MKSQPPNTKYLQKQVLLNKVLRLKGGTISHWRKGHFPNEETWRLKWRWVLTNHKWNLDRTHPSWIVACATAAHYHCLADWILVCLGWGWMCERLVEILSLSERRVQRWFDVEQKLHCANSVEDSSNTTKGFCRIFALARTAPGKYGWTTQTLCFECIYTWRLMHTVFCPPKSYRLSFTTGFWMIWDLRVVGEVLKKKHKKNTQKKHNCMRYRCFSYS